MAGYALDQEVDVARRRLALLEELLDPGTTRRLKALNVQLGDRCLEVGAGGGSIALWLSDAVGPHGSVVAVDLNTALLEENPPQNVTVLRHNVALDGIPGSGYDLIHARATLTHIPERDGVLADLVAALRPGGWLLLEEGDLSPCLSADSAAFVKAMEWFGEILAGCGMDRGAWARQLPAQCDQLGLSDVTAEGATIMVRGGSTHAELLPLSWDQLRVRLDLHARAALDAGALELADPTKWFPIAGIVAVQGRRPGG